MSKTYIGIDPGAKGALAYTGPEGMDVYRFDKNDYHEISDVLDMIAHWHTSPVCILENVHSMPGQGVRSTFSFGTSYGIIQGLLIAHRIPFELVSPRKWQQGLGVKSKKLRETKTMHKNKLKQMAQNMFPTRKVTLADADALLIMEYCRRVHSE